MWTLCTSRNLRKKSTTGLKTLISMSSLKLPIQTLTNTDTQDWSSKLNIGLMLQLGNKLLRYTQQRESKQALLAQCAHQITVGLSTDNFHSRICVICHVIIRHGGTFRQAQASTESTTKGLKTLIWKTPVESLHLTDL